MSETIPFNNQKLLIIQNRSKDKNLLLDMVPNKLQFFDLYQKDEPAHSADFSGKWVRLGLMAGNLAQWEKVENISSLELLEGRFEPYPYQLKVALNVMREKSGIALLADEVGLGKTIEVGIILKEHIVRGNIDSILIITPKALEKQWQEEMKEKFDEDFVTFDDENFHYDHNRIIISFNRLSRNIHNVTNRQWDLVIVDEAHMLINTTSQRRQAVAQFDRRYMLLCTATPLCNKLTDIYSLVDLLYPGLLGSERDFRKTYFYDRSGRICKSEMKVQLKSIVSKVMIRTLRNESGIPFPDRYIYSVRIKGSQEEYDIIHSTLSYMRSLISPDKPVDMDEVKSEGYLLSKEIFALQQSLSSSSRALEKSLKNRLEKYPEQKKDIEPLLNKLSKTTSSSKVEILMETLNKMPDEQAVIFTVRLETAYMLADVLNENFMTARVYEGRLSGHERQDIVHGFRQGRIQYLVATDAAAEGLNLQAASIIINYDLHWNPMKLEQRIGRLHRRGQEKDVNVFNLVIQDTMDDYILKVLFEKIDLFKNAIGDLEDIISEAFEEKSLEEALMEVLLRSSSQRDIEMELEEIGKKIEYQREQHALREEFTRLVLD